MLLNIGVQRARDKRQGQPRLPAGLWVSDLTMAPSYYNGALFNLWSPNLRFAVLESDYHHHPGALYFSSKFLLWLKISFVKCYSWPDIWICDTIVNSRACLLHKPGKMSTATVIFSFSVSSFLSLLTLQDLALLFWFLVLFLCLNLTLLLLVLPNFDLL